MHPSPPKKEEELAEYVETWQNKMRRLEARGGEFKFAPLFKVHALRMLMTGKAKEHFDLWEADHDSTNVKQTCEELLSKVKDYARRRKLDTTAKERIQQGGDPMVVGVVGGYSWEEQYYDQDGVYAIGLKRKGKG